MTGKVVGVLMVMIAVVFGAFVYWSQEYAYYQPVSFQPGAEIVLTPIESDVPEAILAENVEGIDADSSPLRFRACFHTPLTQGMLTETYRAYETAVPLNGPEWFDCFDAGAIGEALDKGEALAFLGQSNITYGIDRVVAVLPDGRAFAWNQINACGEQVFNGGAAPEGCPPVPPNTPKE